MYNDRRLARTRSCPTLFAVLKEQMVQGKKIRLSRGTLNYIKSKKAGKFYKSTSSSELETILEGDEGDNYTDDDTLSSCSVSSSHSEPADMSDVACSTTAEAPSAYTLEHRLPGSLRISPRRLNQWSDSVVIQRYIPLGQKNSNTFRNVAENSSHGHSLYPVQSEKNSSSVYKDKNAPQHNSYISSLLDSSNLSFLNKESKSRKDEKQDSVPKREQSETSNETYGNRRNMDIIHPGQLWLPPVEWRVENMESLVWKDQHIYHKEEGGWWMERWTLRTESRQKLGDADGTPWSEWWLETELPNSNTNTCAAYIKKFGQKWGRNAKGERWYETWQVKNDGKVETTYRLERAKSGNF